MVIEASMSVEVRLGREVGTATETNTAEYTTRHYHDKEDGGNNTR